MKRLCLVLALLVLLPTAARAQQARTYLDAVYVNTFSGFGSTVAFWGWVNCDGCALSWGAYIDGGLVAYPGSGGSVAFVYRRPDVCAAVTSWGERCGNGSQTCFEGQPGQTQEPDCLGASAYVMIDPTVHGWHYASLYAWGAYGDLIESNRQWFYVP